MNASIVINGKTFSIISRQTVYENVERVTLESANGSRKTAMFYAGAFDVWETKDRPHSKFTRVNMRS
jgi:hypothetical protein